MFNLRGRRGAAVVRVDFALFVWVGCGRKGAAASRLRRFRPREQACGLGETDETFVSSAGREFRLAGAPRGQLLCRHHAIVQMLCR